ncbi:MAG: Holliday junction branch migration DNA helicase RuvB [Chlorobi bacterium]|nr:Holliday junction branch migration DNA helicase RuvB [Chlorobiota bacterium]
MISESSSTKEREVEATLRPQGFEEFVGQTKVVENLDVFIKAARMRGNALDHVLLNGPPGLGKTTLSYIISNEMGADIKTTSGPVLEKAGDLAGLLTSLDEGDVLFIDEIHRLSPLIEEYLYSAMEDYRIDIMIDTGPSARSVPLTLPQFTLVGATTRQGLLTAPLRSRFGIISRLDYYSVEDLFYVITRSAGILDVEIQEGGAYEIAQRSRGTPRIANRLLRRTRDFADVKGEGTVTKQIADIALSALEVDEHGLDDMDKRILLSIIEKFNGGPVGLNTLAIAVGEEAGTVEEVYEPYLIQEGFLQRTPRGREATHKAYEHFDLSRGRSMEGLFEE